MYRAPEVWHAENISLHDALTMNALIYAAMTFDKPELVIADIRPKIKKRQ
jgi:hypothetical protein